MKCATCTYEGDFIPIASGPMMTDRSQKVFDVSMGADPAPGKLNPLAVWACPQCGVVQLERTRE